MDISCYNNIVGVSQNGCSCISESSDSLSGLYLDDTTIGHIPLNASIFSCNDADISAFLTTLIEKSTNQVIANLRKSSDRIMNKRYLDMSTVIGWKDSWTEHLTIETNWFYLAIKPKFKRGLYFKIESIEWLIQETGRTINYQIFDEFGNGIQSGNDLSLFEEVTLPMDRKYFICVMDDAGTPHPKNTTAKTCCGYSPTYPTYVDIGSGYVDNYADLQNQPATTFKKSIDTYGIIVTGQFICNGYDFICGLDFKNSNFGSLFANTVQQQSRLNLAMWLVSNNKVTNYVLMNGDQLAQTMSYLQEKIDENLNYLPTIYNYSDCYNCPGSYKGSILI